MTILRLPLFLFSFYFLTSVHGQEKGFFSKISAFLFPAITTSSSTSSSHPTSAQSSVEDQEIASGRCPEGLEEKYESSEEVILRNEYTTNRGIDWYVKYFSPYDGRLLGVSSFDRGNFILNFLEGLKGNDHILDAGSGETQAMGEYLGLYPPRVSSRRLRSILERPVGQKANVTAVSYIVNEDTQKVLRKEKKLNLLTGKFFEDIDDNIIMAGKNKFKAIFDVYGVLSYSSYPDKVLKKYFNLLQKDGIIFLKTGPRHFDSNPHRPRSSMYRSLIKTKDGRTLSLPDWLSTLPGIEVYDINSESLGMIIKESGKINIPKLVLIECKQCKNPPHARTFLEMP